MTTPLAQSGPAARRKGPQIAAEPQNTRQKDGSRICWNTTKAFSFKKKGSLNHSPAYKLLIITYLSKTLIFSWLNLYFFLAKLVVILD